MTVAAASAQSHEAHALFARLNSFFEGIDGPQSGATPFRRSGHSGLEVIPFHQLAARLESGAQASGLGEYQQEHQCGNPLHRLCVFVAGWHVLWRLGR